LTGETLAIVHRNELRLLKLVNTLLDFSRIEAWNAADSPGRGDRVWSAARSRCVDRRRVRRAPREADRS
jgi:hypothetical protein